MKFRNCGQAIFDQVGRRSATILWVLALAAIGAAVGDPLRTAAKEGDAAGFPFFEPVDPPRPVQVMVHRGVMRAAPENTKRALEMCVEDYLEWAEVDVRLSKDGKHVIFHDSRLDGKTNGKGAVSDLTLAQLLELDAGSWFAPRFKEAHLLSLEQCLALAKGKINLYLDCKQIDPESLVREVLAAGMERQVIVFAGIDTLDRVRMLSEGKIPVMPKWRPEFGFDDWIKAHRPAAVEINAPEVTEEACRSFHRHGIKVQAQTLGTERDRPDVWEKVIAAGVDWIQTDFPLEVLTHSLRRRLPRWPVRISHHRAASRYAPENTIPAIETSLRLGADFIELDIRTTRDGKYYLLHDGTLNRTTNGKGKISDESSAAIEKLDAGSWFGKPFVGAGVPTFESALPFLAGKTDFYCDAKAIEPAALIAALEKHGLIEHTIVYQSPEYLRKLKQSNSKIGLLPPLKRAEDLQSLADGLQPHGVDAAWTILSKEMIDRCHSLGILVFSDALGFHENVKEYLKAMDAGIDVIQTDHPARVLRAVELFGGKK